MAYDPFAPVVVPPVPAPAVPPPPTDPNNALAPVVAAPAPGTVPVSSTPAPTGGPAHPLSFVGPGGHIADIQGFLTALQGWRGDRPDRPQGPMDATARQDWRGQIQDWRSQRPSFRDYFGHSAGGSPTPTPGVPVMTPGGGTTGAPLQPDPGNFEGSFPSAPGTVGIGQNLGGTVGMVPGVPGSMATNPGARAMPGVPNFGDWRGPRGRVG